MYNNFVTFIPRDGMLAQLTPVFKSVIYTCKPIWLQ